MAATLDSKIDDAVLSIFKTIELAKRYGSAGNYDRTTITIRI